MATATKLGRVVTYLKGIPTTELLGPLVTCSFEWHVKLKPLYVNYQCLWPIKLNNPLVTWSSNISWQTKTIISITIMLMTTKFTSVMTYHRRVSPIKTHDSLITWSCEITWQAKLIESISTPNLVGWWQHPSLKATLLFDHVTNVRWRGILKNFNSLSQYLWVLTMAGCWVQKEVSVRKHLSPHRLFVIK